MQCGPRGFGWLFAVAVELLATQLYVQAAFRRQQQLCYSVGALELRCRKDVHTCRGLGTPSCTRESNINVRMQCYPPSESPSNDRCCEDDGSGIEIVVQVHLDQHHATLVRDLGHVRLQHTDSCIIH